MPNANAQRVTFATVVKPLIVFFTHLIGPNGAMWWAAFNRFLRKENPWTDRILNLWNFFMIGGRSAEKLIAEIEMLGMKISGKAREMLNHANFTNSKRAKKVNFAMKKLRDFGFTESPTFLQFIERVRNHELYELCLAEDAPNVRLQYADQPIGEWIRFVMDTIPDAGGSPRVFGLEHDGGGVSVRSGWCSPDEGLGLDGLWAVRIRK